MDNVVVVSYLPKTFANKTVEQYFKDAGDVLSVEKVTSGTAFVTFKTHDDAVRAIQTKQNTKFGDRVLQVRRYSCFFSKQFWSCAFTETIDYFEIKIGKRAVDKLIGDVAFRCAISDKIMHTHGKLWLRLPEHFGITFLHGGHGCKVSTARRFYNAFKPMKELLETTTSRTTPPLPVSGQHSFSLVEIMILGVSPAHFAVLWRSNFLEEWLKEYNYEQKATLDKDDSSVKIKVSEENVHSTRDSIIRYIENITEEGFSVPHEIAKMYEEQCAKEWVQQRLDKSKNVCQWKLTQNTLTVVAHKADHPALREFFETVFRKDTVNVKEPLEFDEWKCFLLEVTKQNREDQPNPVIMCGKMSITIVDIPSNIDSTIAAVKKFLARNTVDSNKITLPETVTDLQSAHTKISSSPCTVWETLEQTRSDTVLTTNDEDVRSAEKHTDDCRLNIEAKMKTKSQPDHLMPGDSEQNNSYSKRRTQEKENTRKSDPKSYSETFGKEDKVEKNENDEKYKPDVKSTAELHESHGPEDSHHDSSYKPGDPKKTCMDSDSVTLSGVGRDKQSRAGDTTHLAAETADNGAQEDLDTSLSLDDISFSCPGLVGSDSDMTLLKLPDEGAVSATNGNLQEPAQPPDDGSLLCKWTNTIGHGCTSGAIPEVVAEIQDTSVDNADTDSGDELWKQLDCLEIDQLMVVARSIGISDQCVSDLRSRYSVDEDFRRNLIDRCATTGNTSRLCRALLLLVQKYSVQKKQAQSLCGSTTTRPAAEKEPPSSDNPTLSSSAVHPVNYDINRGQYKHFDSDHNLPHARTGHGSDSFMQHRFTGPRRPLTSTFAFPAAQFFSRSPSNMSYRSWGEQPGFMYPHYSFDQAAGDWSGSFPSNTVPKTYVQGQRFASETGHQSQQAWTGVHTEAASPEQTQLGYLQSHRQRNRVELSTEPRRETSAKSQMDPKFSPALTAEEEKEEAQAATSPQQQSPCCHHRADDEVNARFAEMEQRMRETLAHMELQIQTRTEVQFQMRLQSAMEAQEQVHLAQRYAFETRLQTQMEAWLDHVGEQMGDVFELKQQQLENRDNVLIIDNDSETSSSAPSSSDSEHNI